MQNIGKSGIKCQYDTNPAKYKRERNGSVHNKVKISFFIAAKTTPTIPRDIKIESIRKS
jgi:hypothetical protein